MLIGFMCVVRCVWLLHVCCVLCVVSGCCVVCVLCSLLCAVGSCFVRVDWLLMGFVYSRTSAFVFVMLVVLCAPSWFVVLLGFVFFVALFRFCAVFVLFCFVLLHFWFC